ERVGRALADDGVAGVGAAVVADDEVVAVGEEVNDLALGLVAPLEADDTGATRGDAWRRRGRHGSDGRLRAAAAALGTHRLKAAEAGVRPARDEGSGSIEQVLTVAGAANPVKGNQNAAPRRTPPMECGGLTP